MTTTNVATRSKKGLAGHKNEQRTRAREQVLQQVKSECYQFPLLAEIVRIQTSREATHKEICAALTGVGLDPAVAKEFKPENAISRALKKMEEDRDINLVRSDFQESVFQFTKKEKKANTDTDADESSVELEYVKEAFVRLDHSNGKVRCKKHPNIARQCQELLDKALEVRTRSDITQIVKQMFETNNAMFPRVGRQGGVYVVLSEHQAFADQVDAFLQRIGGELFRMPIPKGTKNGDRAVKMAVKLEIDDKIEELRETVNNLNLNSRGNTFSNAAGKVKGLKTQIEAHAYYLDDLKAKCFEALEQVDEVLIKKIDEQKEEKKNNTQPNGKIGRDKFGARLGSNIAKFNAAMTLKPQAMNDILDKAGLGTNTKYNHCRKMVNKGYFLKVGDKFALNPNPPKQEEEEEEDNNE